MISLVHQPRVLDSIKDEQAALPLCHVGFWLPRWTARESVGAQLSAAELTLRAMQDGPSEFPPFDNVLTCSPGGKHCMVSPTAYGWRKRTHSVPLSSPRCSPWRNKATHVSLLLMLLWLRFTASAKRA